MALYPGSVASVWVYRDVMGLKVVTNESGWRELDAGGITIALHSGPPSPGKKGPKIAFYAKDVAKTRDALVKRGAKFGKAGLGGFCLCLASAVIAYGLGAPAFGTLVAAVGGVVVVGAGIGVGLLAIGRRDDPSVVAA